jgi:hypothetical protein
VRLDPARQQSIDRGDCGARHDPWH